LKGFATISFGISSAFLEGDFVINLTAGAAAAGTDDFAVTSAADYSTDTDFRLCLNFSALSLSSYSLRRLCFSSNFRSSIRFRDSTSCQIFACFVGFNKFEFGLILEMLEADFDLLLLFLLEADFARFFFFFLSPGSLATVCSGTSSSGFGSFFFFFFDFSLG
jgi:hypothetical protein